ncbi:Chromodomain helicase [Venturia inaequalis]|nr:Chromodomain helicase [Venturia inaequalis]
MIPHSRIPALFSFTIVQPEEPAADWPHPDHWSHPWIVCATTLEQTQPLGTNRTTSSVRGTTFG